MFQVVKHYENLPAAHRQPKHQGHCRQIHGHNWSFDITFRCQKLDVNDFVVDVGELAFLKDWINSIFDHTLLLNKDDPKLEYYKKDPNCTVVVVPNCGMEGLARFVFHSGNALLSRHLPEEVTSRGLQVIHVQCFEDSKNSAEYFETP